MSPHQIVGVAVRLFAVWLAATSVVSAPTVYAQLLEFEFASTSSWAIVSFMVLVGLGIAFFLWRFPLTIAGKLLTPSAKQPEETASPDLWLALGCAILGLWLITSHVPNLITVLTFGGFAEWSAAVWLPDLIGIALGLWLVLGAKGFRGLFWWARNAGHPQPPSKG